MELRQGLGRLLRSETDSGKVLILDNRIVNEPYGKSFARIWDMKQVVANTVDDIKKWMAENPDDPEDEEFYGGEK
jgi:ATP-dependent DNA helicase DinG